MKRYFILLILLSILGITSCKTVPNSVRYYDIVPPPTRPALVQFETIPTKEGVHNLSLLMTYSQKWEKYFADMKAYDSL